MSSRVEERPNFFKMFVPILLPATIGYIGKIWTYFTGKPADTKLLLIVIAVSIFGGIWTWKLSKVNYPVPWGRSLYKLTSAGYFLLALIFSAVIAFK